MRRFAFLAAVAALLGALVLADVARAEDFPFGRELTLDVAPMRGSKRVPRLEIGDSGQARVDLWCASLEAQFSVAGDSVLFLPGAVAPASCEPDRARADEALLAALGSVTSWTMQGNHLVLTGERSLRFFLNSN